MILALPLTLAAALTPPPAAPRWETVGIEGGIETSFDPDSVQAADRKVRLRIRGVAATAGPDGIRTVSGLIELDCRARTRTSIEVRAFDANGALVLAALVPPAERVAEPIRPGSPTAAIAGRICGSAGQ